MRNLHLRGRRDESDAGDGLCAKTPASSAMRDGEEMTFGQPMTTLVGDRIGDRGWSRPGCRDAAVLGRCGDGGARNGPPFLSSLSWRGGQGGEFLNRGSGGTCKL